MKKEYIYKFLYAISIVLIICFAITTVVDYFRYKDSWGSAPFYAYVIIRALEFVVPSIIVFIVGLFCKKKYKK